MQVSTRGRYALRFLLDLAQNQGEGFVALRDVAARQDLSVKYLERIVSMLTPSGMLRIARGQQGGYSLARRPDQISVAEVLRLTEISLAPVSYADLPPDDMTVPVWRRLEAAVVNCLESITLQDLLNESGSYYCTL